MLRSMHEKNDPTMLLPVITWPKVIPKVDTLIAFILDRLNVGNKLSMCGAHKQLFRFNISPPEYISIDSGSSVEKAKKTKKIYDKLLKINSDYINCPKCVLWLTFGERTFAVSVLNYCVGEDWFEAMDKQSGKQSLTYCEMKGLGNALDKIHAEGYAIMDIKPDNIVFCDKPSFIDLDDLRHLDDTTPVTRGTRMWSVILWLNEVSVWDKLNPIVDGELLKYVDWFSMAMLVVMNYGQTVESAVEQHRIRHYMFKYTDSFSNDKPVPNIPKLANAPELVSLALDVMNAPRVLVNGDIKEASALTNKFKNELLRVESTLKVSTLGKRKALVFRW